MDAWESSLLKQLVKCLTCKRRLPKTSMSRTKDKVLLLPLSPRFTLCIILFFAMRLQNVMHNRDKGDCTLTRLRFRITFDKLILSSFVVYSAVNIDRPLLKIDILPSKSRQFAMPHSSCQRKGDECFQ